jgi:hypothetical protein
MEAVQTTEFRRKLNDVTFDHNSLNVELGGFTYEMSNWCEHMIEYEARSWTFGATADVCDLSEPAFSIYGNTPYPSSLPVLKLGASVNIEKEGGSWDVQGCLTVELACEDLLKRFGLQWAANWVCDIITLDGDICSDYDWVVGGKCLKYGESVFVRKNERYCAKYRSSDGACISRKRASSDFWLDTTTYESFSSNWMIGVDGRLSVAANALGQSASASILLKYWYINSDDDDLSSDLENANGHYMSIFVEAEADLGWLGEFSAEFQVLPYDGDTQCSEKHAMWDEQAYQKISFG